MKHLVVPHRAPSATPRHDDLSVSAQGNGRDDVGAVVHGPVGRGGSMTDADLQQRWALGVMGWLNVLK